MKNLKQNFGFTILELMIGLAILSFITIGLLGASRQILGSQSFVQGEDSQQQAVVSSLDKMYWDLNMAFFTKSRDFLGSKFEGTLGFVGTSDRLDFLTFNHLRYMAGAKESEAAEVSYYLGPSETDSDQQVLYRRESPQIDRDFKEGGIAYPLLEGVQRLEFRYLPFGKDEEYKNTWDTDGLDNAGRLPWMVEINLEVVFPEIEEPKLFKMLVPIQFRLPLAF